MLLAVTCCLNACSTQSQNDAESLYETEGVDLRKIRRPGSGGGGN